MGEDDRLPTELWLKAHLAQCSHQGIPAMVLRRGAAMGGLVVLRLDRRDGTVRVLSQTRDMDGRTAWLAAGGPGSALTEAEADAYLDRAVRRDPDLWVVEIEHPQAWHPFEGRELA